jgi:hypothetical protein
MQGGARAVSGRDKIEVLRQVQNRHASGDHHRGGRRRAAIRILSAPAGPHAGTVRETLRRPAVDEHVAHPRDGAHLGHRTDVAQRDDQRAMLLLIPSAAAMLVGVGLRPGESLGEGAAAVLGQQLASEPAIESRRSDHGVPAGHGAAQYLRCAVGGAVHQHRFFLRSARTGARRRQIPRC